jgi:hypothetical protein
MQAEIAHAKGVGRTALQSGGPGDPEDEPDILDKIDGALTDNNPEGTPAESPDVPTD